MIVPYVALIVPAVVLIAESIGPNMAHHQRTRNAAMTNQNLNPNVTDVLAVLGDDELLVHLSAGDHACEADQIAHYHVVSEVRKPSINGFRERRVWVMHSDFYAITDGADWWSRQPYPAGDLRGSDSEEFSTRKEARAALARVRGAA